MKIKTYIIITCALISLLSCSKKEDDDGGGSGGGDSAPEAAILVSPENGTECNTGVNVNALSSRVTFEWSASDNTTRYEVFIEDLETNEIIEERTTATQAYVTIKKGTAYRWYVVSKNTTTESANSETWLFFNAGDGDESHTPFPADIVSPLMGHSFNSSTTQLDLQWSATDIDNDISSYEVLFDTNSTPTTSMGETTSNDLSVTVASGNTYYWQVITTDQVGNTSTSDVFWFKVE